MVARSKKIRKSAQGQDCTLRLAGCNFNPETTVLAHVGSNRGMGFKCGDNIAVYACDSCHRLIDGEHRKAFAGDILRALEETQGILIEKGLLVIA